MSRRDHVEAVDLILSSGTAVLTMVLRATPLSFTDKQRPRRRAGGTTKDRYLPEGQKLTL